MTIANNFISRVAPVLRTAIGYIRAGTARLTPRDDWVEHLKRRLALIGNPFFAPLGRPLVFECHDEDYFTTVYVNSEKAEVALFSRYQRNLVSTRKYRVSNGVRDWANGSWVYDPDDTDWQHHVYIFDNGDGTTDIYGHVETSAEKDPYGHVTDEQYHGDPKGLARGTLDKQNISYT